MHALKRYLAYVETQGRAAVRSIGGEPDSDFEVEVATRLRARGYEVEMQVGVSSFRIDLGVRHPDHPERFLAGVECDGAAFHSSKSARDRDRLREAMLNNLGWDLVRIWSTDWYDDPDLETEKVAKKLEELRRRPPPEVSSYRPLRGAAPGHLDDALTSVDATRQEDVGSTSDGVLESCTDVGSLADDGGVRDADSRFADAGVAGGAPPAAGHLASDGLLTPTEATAILEEFRERVVRPAVLDWEPNRSILRAEMIDVFVRGCIADPADWYQIPQQLRSSTAAVEKERFLEAICDIVARIRPPMGAVRRQGPADAGLVEDPRRGPSESASDVTCYAVADPAAAAPPDRERFYDAGYLPTLRTMVATVLAVEAPIYEDLLVERIARAHGQLRSGWQIRRRVLAALPAGAVSLEEGDGRKVVWVDATSALGLPPFRSDARGLRSHNDIPVRELASLAAPLIRLRMDDESILRRMADAVQVARLRESTRTRMMAALAIARQFT